MLKSLLAIGGIAIVINEIRGIIMAGPILYALVIKGYGGIVAVVLLLGIVLSVIVPLIFWWKRIKNYGTS